MDESLEALRAFILPGGHPIVSQVHIARCVCRRTERLMVALLLSDDADENRMIKYINRLSDYLFTLSRYVAKLLNASEIEWKPRIN
jgi:cob(I)alamin adenosyltransferase